MAGAAIAYCGKKSFPWLCCALVAALALLQTANGQGLKSSGTLAASNTPLLATYRASLDRARTLVRSYRAMDRAARESCSSRKSRAALCAGQASEDADALALATNAQAWSWHTGAVGALQSPFGPVGDQGDCWTCVAFSITAVAEAAVARVLGLAGGSVSISEQDLGFCPEENDNLKFCQSSWDMLSALNQLKSRGAALVTKNCLPYTVATSDDPGSKCKYRCNTVDANAAKGTFLPRQIRNIAAAQRQIRMHGGVVTRINIYKDFRPFFAKNPTGVYEGTMCTAGKPEDLEQEHAVVIVGYDNNNQFWIARNSWGPRFGDKGYFRIRFGVCGVASPGEAYGVVFQPAVPPRFKPTMSPDPDGRPGCFVYRARAGDSLGLLADTWQVSVAALVANNTQTVDDLDEPLEGKFINVCGAQNINVLGMPQAQAPANKPAAQPAQAAQPQPAPAAVPQRPRQPAPVLVRQAPPGTVTTQPQQRAPANPVPGLFGDIGNMVPLGVGLMTGGLIRPGSTTTATTPGAATTTTAGAPPNAMSIPFVGSLMGRKLLMQADRL